MKKLLLLLLFASILTLQAAAQTCTPDETVPDSVVVSPLPFDATTNPTGGINDTACINEPFEFVVTVNVPSTFNSPFGPVPINSIDMATEGAVKNLPVGMDYVCNPPNCVFPKENKGCILLVGTPNDTAGVYNLAISFLIRSVLDFPINFPDPTIFPGNYFLHLKPEGQCAPSSVAELAKDAVRLTNRPNPFTGWTQILVNSTVSGNFDLVVSDLLGKTLHRERINLLEGENTLDYDGTKLPEGLYIYTLSDGFNVFSNKMIVSRR